MSDNQDAKAKAATAPTDVTDVLTPSATGGVGPSATGTPTTAGTAPGRARRTSTNATNGLNQAPVAGPSPSVELTRRLTQTPEALRQNAHAIYRTRRPG